MNVHSIRPFVPAKDFARSRELYQALVDSIADILEDLRRKLNQTLVDGVADMPGDLRCEVGQMAVDVAAIGCGLAPG